MKKLILLLLCIASLPSFGQMISNLPSGGSIGDTDLFIDTQGYTGTGTGTTAKVTGSQLKAYITATALQKTSNLSDVSSVSTARTNLGLGGLSTVAPGAGVVAALGSVVNSAGGVMTLGTTPFTPFGSPIPASTAIPSGSVCVFVGDSILQGYNGSINSTSPPQYLSGLPAFAGIPCYSYAISGTTAGPTSGTANSGLAIMAASSPAYTKYLNGAQVTTGNASVASWYPGTGNLYVFFDYGANDILGINGMTLANFETSMTSLWTTAHGIGANVKVIGHTITDSTHYPKQNTALWNGWLKFQTTTTQGPGAGFPDYIADENAVFSDVRNDGVISTDGLHLLTNIYRLYAQVLGNAVLQNITLPSNTGYNVVLRDQQIWTDTQNNTFNYPLEIFNSNALTSGGYEIFAIGGTNSNNNTAFFYFNNVGGSGSTSNLAAMSVKGGGALTVDGTGLVTLPGDAIFPTAGAKITMKAGRTLPTGIAMVSGSATFSDTSVTAGDVIIPACITPSANAGALYLFSKTVSTGYVIKSTNAADTGTVTAHIIRQN